MHPDTSREVNEARLPDTYRRPCAFKNLNGGGGAEIPPHSKHTAKPTSIPPTATNSKRPATKQVPHVSPNSPASSVDTVFVQIGHVQLFVKVLPKGWTDVAAGWLLVHHILVLPMLSLISIQDTTGIPNRVKASCLAYSSSVFGHSVSVYRLHRRRSKHLSMYVIVQGQLQQPLVARLRECC